MHTYKTKGTCSTEINFSIENDIITDVKFTRGCNGNLSGISVLVKGMKVSDAISKLEGIDCNGRGTSCPDQLAEALKEWQATN
jgi:uncharacterized protein (TIGR03905 family)